MILYDRVEALARRTSIPADTILGDAMAHEIGHVLLGSSPHATAGLMQANWDAGALRLASQGLLAFWPREAAAMKAAVARLQARRRLPQAQPTLASAMRERK